MKSILLVDDDIRVFNLITPYLNPDEKLFYSQDTDDVMEKIQTHGIKLVILDINLDKEDGLKYFSQFKEQFLQAGVSVFFLTQDTSIHSKVSAFQFGADDYLVKPFEPLELIARIRAKLVKSNLDQNIIHKGDLEFNMDSRTLWLNSYNGREQIDLSATEFKLMYFLAKREGRVFSRNELLETVWGEQLNVTDRTIDQHISRLRKKVKSQSFLIKTHFNEGYSLSPAKKRAA
jgi:DNA-binding response OmpR family regulator